MPFSLHAVLSSTNRDHFKLTTYLYANKYRATERIISEIETCIKMHMCTRT